VLVTVFLSDFIPIPQNEYWATYAFNAFVDYTAILFLIPLAVIYRISRMLIATYAVYIMVHFAGFMASWMGVVILYDMYPKVLIGILLLQLIIMAIGYGDIRGIRRRDESDSHIPAVIVADSFNNDLHKKAD
jgi:hypothetical protein